MAAYRCEVAYYTKRGGVFLGMTIEACDEDEAMELAKAKALKGYPARRWAYTSVKLVTPAPKPRRKK
jgi:hypothetical protein